MNAPALHLVGSERAGSRESNVLVVALDAAFPAELPDAEILVVAPALNSWLRHWLSDEDAARRRAEERASGWLERLDRSGIHARARVGDPDPLRAIADALVTFPADEVVIAARPPCATPLASELVSRVRERFALPASCAAELLPRAA